MDMMECLEAYGLDRGKVKCRELVEDFQECVSEGKQYLRMAVSGSRNIKRFENVMS